MSAARVSEFSLVVSATDDQHADLAGVEELSALLRTALVDAGVTRIEDAPTGPAPTTRAASTCSACSPSSSPRYRRPRPSPRS